MKTVPALILLVGTSVFVRSEIQLRGVLHVGTDYVLALADSEEQVAPHWVRVVGAFRDCVVQSYDPAAEVAHLRKKGVAVDAKLVTSHIQLDRDRTVDIRSLSDEGLVLLGLYRVKPGDTATKIAATTQLSIPDFIAMNPGVRFDSLRPDQILAISKGPNQALEPTSGTVTPPADAGAAPVPPVAHH